MNKAKEKQVSPYTILNRWLYDGSKQTSIPEELVNDKVIPNTLLLYHFQSSPFILYLSEHFNNYDLYLMDKASVLKFLKQCVLLSGYKPPFIEKIKTEKKKISKVLKLKFPYLKMYEINHLVDLIDNDEENKDTVYETLGFYQPKKKKTTKAEKDLLEQSMKENKTYTLKELMSNFI